MTGEARFEGPGGFTLWLLPVVYPGLPDPTRFIAFCRDVAAQANEDRLLKYYSVSVDVAEKLLPLCESLCEGIVPPRERRFNSLDGWLTTDALRWQLDRLWTADPVTKGSTLTYPALDSKDLVLALIPASVETTPDVWATEKHFGIHAAWMGRYRSKAAVVVYHVRLRAASGEMVEESYRELNAASLADDLVDNIATQHLAVPDPQMELIRIEFGYETRLTAERPEVGERLCVLYFGGSFCSAETLKRTLLLFDDIHFHDRPSLTFGNWGLVGGNSEARRYAFSFAEAGVPVLVHIDSETLRETALDAIASDLEDPEFSRVFFDALRDDELFRARFLPEGAQYGGRGASHSGREVADALMRQDFGGRAYDLNHYREPKGRIFDPSDSAGLEGTFVQLLVSASHEVNLCCVVSHENDLLPLTELRPFYSLLARRHARAIQKTDVKLAPSPVLPYLSFCVFDRLIPKEVLDKLSVAQAVELRKATRGVYASFRRQLVLLHSKLDSSEWSDELKLEVERLLVQEVEPLAREFEQESARIVEELLGNVYKEALRAISPTAVSTVALNALLGLSWAEILVLGCALMSSKVLPHIRDFYQERRNLRRRNALTYLIDLGKGLGGA